MAFRSRLSTIEKRKMKKATFFDMLKISDLNIIVDPLGKIQFEESTIK